MNWTAIIVAGIALIGTVTNGYFLYMARKEKKHKKPNNPGTHPALLYNGRSFLCLSHGEKLGDLESAVARLVSDVTGIKTDIKILKERGRT